MEKTAHFSFGSAEAETIFSNIKTALEALIAAGGGGEAVFKEALSIVETVLAGTNTAWVQTLLKVLELIANGSQAQAK